MSGGKPPGAPNVCECGGESRVLETRARPHDGGTRRRRECLRCGSKWTTVKIRIAGGMLVSSLSIQAIKKARAEISKLLDVLKGNALADDGEATP